MPIYDACAAGVTLLGGSGDTGNGVAAYRAGVGSRSPISSGQQAAPVPGAGSGALHTGHGSGPQHDKLLYHLERYYGERVQNRKSSIRRTIGQVVGIVQDLLKEVESQEPRFISSLTEINNHYDGLQVISPNEFEVVLYLNQMGVFNFVDDGTIPGCAVLKLSDGRKRSMSLWVEFITASGYLSARKIRSRFQTLVAQAVEKCGHRDNIKMISDTSEVKLKINDRYIVQVTPAFKCAGIWPRSASNWPPPHVQWPVAGHVNQVKNEGFDLLSRESVYMKPNGAAQGLMGGSVGGCSLGGASSADKAGIGAATAAAEGDAWVVAFTQAERALLRGGCRRKCLSVLRTLRDAHLELPGQPVDHYHVKTLLLHECGKHPREDEWTDACLGDRINGIVLQMISCLQNRKCAHYFLPNLDLFKGKQSTALDAAARQAWRILRELLTNGRSLEQL